MSQLRKIHAAAFNFLACAFGVMAIINGFAITIWGLSLVLDHKATIDANGAPSDSWEKVEILVIGVVVFAIGVLVLKARSYKPRE